MLACSLGGFVCYTGHAQNSVPQRSVSASLPAAANKAAPVARSYLMRTGLTGDNESDVAQAELDEIWRSDLSAGVVGSEPVPVPVRITSAATAFDWTDEHQRQKVCNVIADHARGSGKGLTEPVILKGVAANWPALTRWNLDWLARTVPHQWVWVRCAPSLRFTYVEPRLMPLYLKFFPASGAPSMLTRMPLAEFAMRSQRASPLPPLFYAWPQRQAQHQQSRRDQQGPDREEEQRQGCEGLPQHSTQAPSGIGEYYYMQTPLTKMLAQDCDLSALPFKLIQGSDAQAPDMIASQMARLWMCPRGGVSPLHYDSTTSFLTQIQGRKRLLFFPPEALGDLGPYPGWHILRRRLRFDPAAPDWRSFPRARALGVVEARLDPGDMLLFPPLWAHYTESLDWSLSMTWRFTHAGSAPRAYKPLRGLCFKWW